MTAAPAPRLPPLPPCAHTALLLDVDGTLLDFAPTPDAVVVPDGLPATLLRLRQRLGGALALISGRPVAQVDALFRDVAQAVAGEHGAAVRHAPGAEAERVNLPTVPDAWIERAERLVAAHPGALLERKARGFVLHYRGAPDAGSDLHIAVTEMIEGDEAFALLPAHMAWEVRPRGADKGTAVTALMDRAPFRGRKPVFIGDDVTDQDAIAAAVQLGGVGMLVADAFGGPAGVRAWLAAVADKGW